MVSGVRVLMTGALAVLLGSVDTSLAANTTQAGASSTPAVGERPNIVVVLTDDMRADELRFLPAVRRLRDSGVTFTRAISADSLCCPARATLLTGKLAHNHLTIGNYPKTFGGYPVFAAHNDIQDLLPQWLGDEGYRTAWIGKYLNETPSKDHFSQPDWSYFAVPVHRIYDYARSRFAINGRSRSDDRYRESYTRHLLLSKVRAWSRGDRPFFVLYSALAPHRAWPGTGAGPPGVQPRYRDTHGLHLDVRPSVHETDLSDKPAWVREYAAKHGLHDYPRKLEVHRVESLLSVNDTVHDLVTTLRDRQELDNTVIVFSSDNGYMLREHDVGDKNKAYEESVHVPLVVRGPGFRGGTKATQTVSLADLTATFRDLAGDTTPHGADGLSLRDVLAEPASFDRRPIEIEGSVALYPRRKFLPTDAIGRFYSGVVWGPYSLVHYKTGDWEFYDRTVDPWQLENAYVEHPASGSPQVRLEDWYADHVDCRGAACNDRLPTH
jgi:N-acetylglucosamine-6-sulfatase